MTTGVPAYSITPASNVQANTGINWDEGMSPGAVNNSARANMADLRTAFNDLIWFQYGSGTSPVVTPAYASGTSFTVAGIDVTTPYHAGRRVKAVGSGTGTIYGTVSSSSFSTNTTVNVTWDSGSLTNEALTIYLSQAPVTGNPIPGPKVSTRQILTSGSGATYNTPANVRQLRIRMLGGGSGGSRINGSAASGGAGGFSSFDNAGTNYKANGAAGPTSAAGGGVPGAGGSGGTGGTSPTTIRYRGGQGGVGGPSRGGTGASSFLGGGGGYNGTAGLTNTGSGGAGEDGPDGGAGGSAGEYVEIIINSPAGSYTYTIGAGGTAAGSAGAGGSGVIIVDEIY